MSEERTMNTEEKGTIKREAVNKLMGCFDDLVFSFQPDVESVWSNICPFCAKEMLDVVGVKIDFDPDEAEKDYFPNDIDSICGVRGCENKAYGHIDFGDGDVTKVDMDAVEYAWTKINAEAVVGRIRYIMMRTHDEIESFQEKLKRVENGDFDILGRDEAREMIKAHIERRYGKNDFLSYILYGEE